MNFSSKLMEKAVNEFASLPGIGKKTALRLVLHLIKQEPEITETFTDNLKNMRKKIKTCEVCFNISDEDVCQICSNKKRDKSLICIVESTRDVMAIESTGQYFGLYHVLQGVISPIDGVGPGDLTIEPLIERAKSNEVKEIIMAISPTIEGETTIYFISNKLIDFDVKISTIARGVSFGGELEYADEVTLGRSIISRTAYENKTL